MDAQSKQLIYKILISEATLKLRLIVSESASLQNKLHKIICLCLLMLKI